MEVCETLSKSELTQTQIDQQGRLAKPMKRCVHPQQLLCVCVCVRAFFCIRAVTPQLKAREAPFCRWSGESCLLKHFSVSSKSWWGMWTHLLIISSALLPLQRGTSPSHYCYCITVTLSLRRVASPRAWGTNLHARRCRFKTCHPSWGVRLFSAEWTYLGFVCYFSFQLKSKRWCIKSRIWRQFNLCWHYIYINYIYLRLF